MCRRHCRSTSLRQEKNHHPRWTRRRRVLAEAHQVRAGRREPPEAHPALAEVHLAAAAEFLVRAEAPQAHQHAAHHQAHHPLGLRRAAHHQAHHRSRTRHPSSIPERRPPDWSPATPPLLRHRPRQSRRARSRVSRSNVARQPSAGRVPPSPPAPHSQGRWCRSSHLRSQHDRSRPSRHPYASRSPAT